MGIAGALGLATIAAPLSGLMSVAPKVVTNTVNAATMAPAPEFPARADRRLSAVADLKVIPVSDPSYSAQVPKSLVAPRTVLVTRPNRSYERAVLPGCDGVPLASKGTNGQLNTSALCTLWEKGEQLRPDAAVAFAKLNVAYRQRFGRNICITDTYRTLSQQQSLHAQKPGMTATPGTSNHGFAAAADLCGGIEDFGTVQYLWMRDNAPRYGWDAPNWARSGGSLPEPWHWQYIPVTGME
ncbi:MAG: peptidase M15 [Actinomycetales bacterium]|nr:peptidase M15 [Actinomycetales bacterium]